MYIYIYIMLECAPAFFNNMCLVGPEIGTDSRVFFSVARLCPAAQQPALAGRNAEQRPAVSAPGSTQFTTALLVQKCKY